jgi:hypothetical protein
MKDAVTMFAAFVLMLAASSVRAEETKAEKNEAIKEWSGSTACAKCNFAKETEAKKCSPAIKVGEKVYLLTGEALKKEMPGCCGKEGEYTVKGKLSEDGKSIEVMEIKQK